MIAYLNGVIKLIDEKKFQSKENGSDVSFNTIFIQVDETDGTQSTVELNTKQDFSRLIDSPVTISLLIRRDFEQKKLWRVSVLDAKENVQE